MYLVNKGSYKNPANLHRHSTTDIETTWHMRDRLQTCQHTMYDTHPCERTATVQNSAMKTVNSRIRFIAVTVSITCMYM